MISLKGGQGKPLRGSEEQIVQQGSLRDSLFYGYFGKVFDLFTDDVDAAFIRGIQFQNTLTEEGRTICETRK